MELKTIRRSRLERIGIAVILVSLVLALPVGVKGNSPINIRLANIAGTPSPSNGVFRIEVAAFAHGYFPQYSVQSAHWRFVLVKNWFGGQIYGPISVGSGIYYGGGEWSFSLNGYNNYVPAYMIPKGDYTVHWEITLVVVSAGQTFTATQSTNSMQIYNR